MKKQISFLSTAYLSLIPATSFALPPRNTVAIDAAEAPRNYRLHIEFSQAAQGTVRLAKDVSVSLPEGVDHDLAVEYPSKGGPIYRLWSGGKLVRGPEKLKGFIPKNSVDFPAAELNLGNDFTAVAKFETMGSGVLFSKCAAQGEWSADAKALFVRNGVLLYEVSGLGNLTGGPMVNDGKPHTAVLSSAGGKARLWLDGKVVAEKTALTKPDVAGHIFKVGRAATVVPDDFKGGRIAGVQVWGRALPDAEIGMIFQNEGKGANTPDFTYVPAEEAGRPVIIPAAGVTVKDAWIQELERSDHSEIVKNWNPKSLEEGRTIYSTYCVTCHGTKEKEGSLPTAMRFAQGQFKNGGDPYSMLCTLTKGYGQMLPQPQYTTEQKYAVIQYIRETFLKPYNASQFVEITPALLTSLPKGLARGEAEKADTSLPIYQRMDLGPALFWTYQIDPRNIVQKGIAIRLDEGPGGVSKGRAWMVYDHDTMRMATGTSGKFVDWRGIAFDGSHGSHTSLSGEKEFVNPVGPGWASPDGKWDDPRPLSRENKPYGPLPREWAEYQGLFVHGDKAVIAATVGGIRVLESPGWIEKDATPVFIRTLNLAASTKPLLLRVAPETASVALAGDGSLRKQQGFWVAELPGGAKTRIFISRLPQPELELLGKSYTASYDLDPLIHGGPPRWAQEVTTTSIAGKSEGSFIADTFPLPIKNPWDSWLRPGGFDFTPDGKAAIVAMWNGDVWRVDGVMDPAPAELHWHRIAGGLFQPLGVKFRGKELFVICRDQLVRLRDLNDDGEIDFIECFNNDHQVTEHFHEFAMGLQTDAAGNFYYAKSARHALPALVPHHGTLLKVSADGTHTDIIANGFRAANGVCVNDDGSYFVTDQEGHWTPKNRINHVKPGGFYGNIFGYTNVTDTDDTAMEQPMVWMTNVKDRSPAELVWIPKNTWGSLGGSLLNLSYGTGRAFIVPHEEINGKWQGAVCELPMPAFPTGIMRGRFASDGALYTSGMFAWAGNASSPGGFYRIRREDTPAFLPLAVHAIKGGLNITLSEPVDPSSVTPAAFTIKVWSLKRSANYGSKHVDEHPLPITAARIDKDGRSITLDIPALAPTQCYEVNFKLRALDGAEITRSIHGTIHQF